MPLPGYLIGVAALLVLALTALLPRRIRSGTVVIYGGSLVVTAVLFAAAAWHLLANAAGLSLSLPLGVPWLGANFRLDALSAFILVVIDFGAAAASYYALGYGRHEHEPMRVLPFYPVFLAAMNLVVLADDAFAFLLSWEMMSLASWALVMSHHQVPGNARAGYVYIVMASIGTFALLMAFGLMAGDIGDYTFAAMRAHASERTATGVVLALALFGAGSKAGLAPFHVWLPLAHPAAPSHVSALMSGVMTKVAVYGFLRIVFDLLGTPVWWWGIPVLATGAVTAVIGALLGLMQNDLKRVLAYSTIENIGVIFIALGLALGFQSHGYSAAAALALTAALFHVLNHSLFKSLLFFGSGALLTATGERNMARLGGLLNRMPMTGLFMLVGCVAISALPPFNGFVSEWLAFQAILLSPVLSSWALKLMIPAVGAMLALAAALAGAAYVRVFGIAFLGRPRSDAATNATEVDRFSVTAMAALGILCLAAGVFPGVVIDALEPLVRQLLGTAMAHQSQLGWLAIAPIAESRSSYDGLLVFLFITTSALLAAVIIHRFASDQTRIAPPWDCGFPQNDPATQYTPESFAQPVRRVFSGFGFAASEAVDMPRPGDLRPAHFELKLKDLIWDYGYQPVVNTVFGIADALNRLQFLTIRQYLSLVFAALVFLLLALAIWT
ncbi:MAG: hydrogenase 4 subunit B [Ancalomicrobiaceae bacterium]|nr:hydrogenase 4 subunit B [Ancalomicrobiaceae bacterium]